MILQKTELYFLKIITGKKHGFTSALIKAILLPLSWVYRFLVNCRNWAFDHGWLRRYSPPVPIVISVGNIVAGGTGKTPVTLMLAKEFYDEVPIAILARGYRSEAERLSTPVVLSRGQGPMHPASFCGDESYMLSQNLPKAFVFVGKDRHKSSNMAAKAGVKIILLDDGMQHRRLARDFEIVVMDAYDPFGQGYFLPRGLLREGIKSLARADLIILNHVYDHDKFIKIRQQIGSCSTAPVVATRTEVAQIQDINNKITIQIKDKKVGVFCGIAHPDYFIKTIEELGAQVIELYSIPDHMDFDFNELANFATICKEKGAELLLCTEKDRVKLVESLHLALPIAWVQMRLIFVEGEMLWKTFIEKAKTNLERSF
jgi:tetraacyldisaccharide 4'-kinase